MIGSYQEGLKHGMAKGSRNDQEHAGFEVSDFQTKP